MLTYTLTALKSRLPIALPCAVLLLGALAAPSWADGIFWSSIEDPASGAVLSQWAERQLVPGPNGSLYMFAAGGTSAVNVYRLNAYTPPSQTQTNYSWQYSTDQSGVDGYLGHDSVIDTNGEFHTVGVTSQVSSGPCQLIYVADGPEGHRQEVVTDQASGPSVKGFYSIAAGKDGRVYVAYNAWNSSGGQGVGPLMLAVRGLDGKWTTDTVDAAPLASETLDMKIGPGGNLSIVYSSPSQNAVVLATGTPGSWAFQTLAQEPGNFPELQIAASGLRRVAYFGVSDASYGSNGIDFSVDLLAELIPGAFQHRILASVNLPSYYFPWEDLTLGPDGTPVLTYALPTGSSDTAPLNTLWSRPPHSMSFAVGDGSAFDALYGGRLSTAMIGNTYFCSADKTWYAVVPEPSGLSALLTLAGCSATWVSVRRRQPAGRNRGRA